MKRRRVNIPTPVAKSSTESVDLLDIEEDAVVFGHFGNVDLHHPRPPVHHNDTSEF
jgi:hypothetical protein